MQQQAVQQSEDPSLSKALMCAKAALDKKAENVKVLDLTNISGFTDYFIVCSGMSDRQIHAISDGIQSELKSQGKNVLTVEGYAEGRWVLMDFGDVVVHIFFEALREYYDLEGLWQDAPRVRIPAEFYGPGASNIQ
jgi:ribosome-associated protein